MARSGQSSCRATPPARVEMVYNARWAAAQYSTVSTVSTVMTVVIPRFVSPRPEDMTAPEAAIRMGDWKYVGRAGGWAGWHPCPPEMRCQALNTTASTEAAADVRHALYNLAADPSERMNLVDQEPAIAEELRARLEEFIVELPEVEW